MTRAECLTEVQEKKGAKANANRRNWPCVSREEGTDSSVSKRKPLLAIESTQKGSTCQSHVFGKVAYICFRLCKLCDPRDTLKSAAPAT